MNNNYDTLHKVLILVVDKGEATIKLGTPESKALIDILWYYKNATLTVNK
jgi:hypothetical protein